MGRKRYSDEAVLKLLREIDVHLHDGLDVVSACRKAGISDKSYYYWRKKFGGLSRSQVSEMKSLKKENERLKKIVADLQRLPYAYISQCHVQGAPPSSTQLFHSNHPVRRGFI